MKTAHILSRSIASFVAKPKRSLIAWGAAGLTAMTMAPTALAQISIGAIGSTITEDFTALPLAGNWATTTTNFGTSANTITVDMTTADNLVNSGVVASGPGLNLAALASVAGGTVATANRTQYYQNGFVGTAATGVDGTVLVATLLNNTGVTLGSLDLTWALTLQNNNVATPEAEIAGHRLYWSLNGTAWTAIGNFGFRGVAGNPVSATLDQTTSVPLASWATGTNAYLLWLDDNAATNPDGLFAIDNVRFTGRRIARNLTYNAAHGVGGAPSGVLSNSPDLYWLDGGNPASFTATDDVTFSQDVAAVANIDVPADVTVGTFTASHTSGTYAVGGIGKISGALVANAAGTLSLPTANSFQLVTLGGGGTVITADTAAFGNANISAAAGGRTIQTNSDLTIAGIVSGAGALTKTGAGTLTLSGANTHTGGISVNAGALRIGGSTSAGGTIDIASGVRITGGGSAGGTTTVASGGIVQPGNGTTGALTFQNLTLAGNATVDFHTGTTSNVTGTLIASGAAGSVLINVSGPTNLNSIFTVLDYTGTIGGTGFSAFAVGTTPNRVIASLTNDAGNTRVLLTITGVDFPLWSGALGGIWATGAQGGAENWVLNSDNLVSTNFVATDSVVFDDFAGNTTVDLTGADVFPSNVTFSNITKNYTLVGNNAIAGTSGFTKSGAGALTIANTNTFTGTANLNGGTVRVTNIGDAGVPSPLGLGTIAFDGGTLEVTLPDTISSRALTFTGSGTVITDSTLTLTGALTGAGSLIKEGTGILTIGGNLGTTATTVSTGTLQIGDGATAGNATGTITNNSIVTFKRTDNVTVTATLDGPGAYQKTDTNTLTLGGAAANTNTGTFTVTAGTVVAGKAAGINAIGGNLIIEAGAFFQYAGNNVSNQIADTSSITINGGTFGGPAIPAVNPSHTDTVANVTVNGGNFHSGRNGAIGNFTITGLLKVTAGVALAQRGGGITANAIEITGGSINMDGGSTTDTLNESRINVGPGGLTISNAAINFNAGPSAFTANDSEGSILTLSGDVTASGIVAFNQGNTATLATQIDLNGGTRTFNILGGTTTIGSAAAGSTISITNGDLIKTGPGTLNIPGNQPYAGSTTINGGTLGIEGTLFSSGVTVGNTGTLSGAGTVSSLTFGASAADAGAITVVRGTTLNFFSVNNALTANGTPGSVLVNVSGPAPALGQYTLIDYNGSIGGTGYSAFGIGTLPNRVVGELVDNAANTSIDINVTAVDMPLWSGALSSEWSIATLAAPKNWVLTSNNLSTTDYLEGDNVLFTDFATNSTVEINGADVTPSAVRFDNSAKNYVLNGTSAIAGAASLVKDGTGSVSITNTNTFTGSVTINSGTISVAILTDAGVPGPLGVNNSVTFGGGTLEYVGGDTTFTRALNFNTGGGTVKTDAILTLSASLSGTAALTKTGTGTVILAATNTAHNGGIVVKEGIVRAVTEVQIGGLAQTITLDGGALEYDTAATVVLSDTAVTPRTRTLTVGPNGGRVNVTQGTAGTGVEFNAPNSLFGAGTLTKDGIGTLRFTGNNPGFTGNWTINAGAVESWTAQALGTGTITVNGGILVVRSVAAPDNVLSNNIILNGGTLGTRSGNTSTFGGNVDVVSASSVALRSNTSGGPNDITIAGILSGTGDLTINGDGGLAGLSLTNLGNTYSGTFRVTANHVLYARSPGTGNVLGTSTIELTASGLATYDDGTGDNGLVVLGNNVILAGTGGQIDVNRRLVAGTAVGNTIQLGRLTIGTQTLITSGGNDYKVAFGSPTDFALNTPIFFTDSADLIFSGGLSGSSGFVKDGPNRLILTGASSITGSADIQGGIIEVNGTTDPLFDIVVSSSGEPATVAGTGTIGGNIAVVSADSSVAPGSNGPGILSVGGNLSFFTGSDYSVDLAHGITPLPIPGTDYDRTAVTGDVFLNDANLVLNLGSGLQPGDLFFIIVNNGSDPINNTFLGLADDTVFNFNFQDFRISYDADSLAGTENGGNDVSLLFIPEPGSATLLLAGLGLLARRRRK